MNGSVNPINIACAFLWFTIIECNSDMGCIKLSIYHSDASVRVLLDNCDYDISYHSGTNIIKLWSCNSLNSIIISGDDWMLACDKRGVNILIPIVDYN